MRLDDGGDQGPSHLSAASRRWYSSVLEEYDLEPHHERLLQAAAEAWDRLQEAREILGRDGGYVEGRYGVRAHPAVAVERELERLRRTITGKLTRFR